MTVGESPPLGTDPLISQLVADRYRVIRKLGEGGMGSVYLAEHVVIEKKLVLKVLAPELARRPDLVARFLQEARSASRIGHENVIDISDFGQSAEGYVYIAMEYLEGKDLGEVVRREGALPWNRAREIVMQICRALRAAHDKGIVHRDMKPENIFLIQREGQPEFVKILDFGIAKIMGLDPNGPRLTRTGMIFGTPEYMAPEQAEGKEADHRVDVYAVGCIAYHLMTGNTPFVAENFMAMLTKHLMEDPVPPSVRRPDLDITPEMDALVLHALEKDRDRRYQTMGEFLEAVTACHGPEKEHQDGAVYTREMGGAHAKAALRAEAPVDRGSETEVVARGWEEAAEQEERASRVIGRSGQKLILAAMGVLLGLAGALWLALSRNRTPSADSGEANRAARPSAALALPPAPAPAAAPAAVPQAGTNPPLPIVAPAPAAPGAEKVEVSEPRNKPGHSARSHKGKASHAASSPRSAAALTPPSALSGTAEVAPAPKPAAPRPAPPPPPAGLKPFPGM